MIGQNVQTEVRMKFYSDEELLMLSGIQHIAFCERQWALIHIEQQWKENLLTVEGQFLNERVDDLSMLKKIL
jgi:CRISPR-associated exonuclease Cas4